MRSRNIIGAHCVSKGLKRSHGPSVSQKSFEVLTEYHRCSLKKTKMGSLGLKNAHRRCQKSSSDSKKWAYPKPISLKVQTDIFRGSLITQKSLEGPQWAKKHSLVTKVLTVANQKPSRLKRAHSISLRLTGSQNGSLYRKMPNYAYKDSLNIIRAPCVLKRLHGLKIAHWIPKEPSGSQKSAVWLKKLTENYRG